jgi:hypothetical protein
MRLSGAALVLFLCIATAVASEETKVDLSLSASNDYYGGTGTGGRRAVLRINPQVRVSSRTARQSFSLLYAPGVEMFENDDFAPYWNHRVMGEYQLQLGPRTSVTFGDTYSDTEIISFGNEVLPDDTVDVVSDASRFIRNNASMTLQHLLSPLWNVDVSLQHNFANFEDPTRNDSETVSGVASVSYSVTVKDQIGLGIQGSYSSFDGAKDPRTELESSGQRNTNIHLIANWGHQFTSKIRMSFSGGPNLGFYDSEKLGNEDVPLFPNISASDTLERRFYVLEDCPRATLSSCRTPTGIVDDNTFKPEFASPEQAAEQKVTLSPFPNPDIDDLKVNFFGSLGISYLSDTWAAQLRGRRVESTQSGIGTATAVTSVNLGINWEPSPDWELDFDAGWSKRTSIAKSLAVVDLDLKDSIYQDLDGETLLESASLPTGVEARAVDREQYRAWGQVRRRLFRDWWIRLTAEYIRQDVRGVSANRYRIGAGVSYDLPSIAF